MPNVTAGSPPPPYVAEEATNDDSSTPSTSVASLADSSSTAGPSNAMRNATASAGVLSSSEPSTSKPSKAKKRKLVMDCVMLRSSSPAVQVGSFDFFAVGQRSSSFFLRSHRK